MTFKSVRLVECYFTGSVPEYNLLLVPVTRVGGHQRISYKTWMYRVVEDHLFFLGNIGFRERGFQWVSRFLLRHHFCLRNIEASFQLDFLTFMKIKLQ